jgi:hypothetical protein
MNTVKSFVNPVASHKLMKSRGHGAGGGFGIDTQLAYHLYMCPAPVATIGEDVHAALAA